MKGTLKIAQDFEDALSDLWDGKGNYPFLGGWIYSCSTVHSAAYKYLCKVAPEIVNDGNAFGPYSDSGHMAGYVCIDYKIKQISEKQRMRIQMQRALWLTMLAELAEQGEEF